MSKKTFVPSDDDTQKLGMAIFESQFTKFWVKRYLIALIGGFVIAGVWFGGMHTYLSSRIGNKYSISIAVVLLISLMIKLQLWRVFTDRSFSGVIQKIRHKETLVSPKGDFRPTATESRYHIYLSVLLGNGKTVTMHIENNEPFYDHLWYHVGDYVVYYRGTKFPLVRGGRIICAYCGHEYLHDDDKCSNCGRISSF